MNETSSLRSLAYKALERLERNKQRNKTETKNIALSEPILPQRSFLSEAYDERRAIAEYDGRQTPTQAQRIAYQDAFIAVLNALPYEENLEGDWFIERIKAAQEWLVSQGLQQPE
ncbi:MAG TPA: hypothetical protein VMW10_11210 [Alphaproteobacteria bacterium]|nr:hypothetical protein [Alphaproteobacteria bacterium]